MIAALFAPLLLALATPREATCPPGQWVNGVRPTGAYECLLTVGDNDSPAIARTSGTLRCAVDEQPIVVDFRRVACRRRSRRTTPKDRASARARARTRRACLRKVGLCINGEHHGPATHGVRCAPCYLVHANRSTAILAIVIEERTGALRPIDGRDHLDFRRCLDEACDVAIALDWTHGSSEGEHEGYKRRLVEEAWRRREAIGFVVREDGVVCRREVA